MKPLIFLASLLLFTTTACNDDTVSTYSEKYPVFCTFQVVSYAELQTAVGSFGQFVSIRMSGGKFVMKSLASENSYQVDALSKDARMGLGGVIVGTTQYGEYRAYDLACSNCDREFRRLSLHDDGTAFCDHCEIVYDLNYDGVVRDAGNGLHEHPRGLYRYYPIYNGTYLTIQNRP